MVLFQCPLIPLELYVGASSSKRPTLPLIRSNQEIKSMFKSEKKRGIWVLSFLPVGLTISSWLFKGKKLSI